MQTTGEYIRSDREYEKVEDWAVDLYVQRELPTGSTHEDRQTDIDRKILAPDGEIDHFLEFKNRSCSLNAYGDTMFRDRKLFEAQELHSAHDVPVRFLFRFLDCWAVHDYHPDPDYDMRRMPRGDRGQYEDHVLVPVARLQVLGRQSDLEGVKTG